MEISNIKRDNQLNERIKERNMIYVNTNINLGIRPVPTKYGYKPIIATPLNNNVPIQNYPTFTVEKNYLPGNRQGPWDGFASHINDESKLKNMFFANTKCQQGLYIPSSNSSLYNVDEIIVPCILSIVATRSLGFATNDAPGTCLRVPTLKRPV